jgi:CPA1 family monovalent cation:H+ antiporter
VSGVIAVVVAGLLVALDLAVTAIARRVSPLEAVGDFLLVGVGGVIVGLVVGQLLSLVRRRVHDSLTDTGVSLVAPFVAFLPAEALHVSGVIAVVVAGLLVAHRAPLEQEPRARLVENSTWAALQYLLEGGVFALIGLELQTVFAGLHSSAGQLVAATVLVLAVVVVVRPLWIFGTSYLLHLALWSDQERPRPASLAVVSWAGIRGVVSLAAALSLPLDFPRRDLMLVVTVAVILGTLGAQGLSLPWVIRRLGVVPPDPRADDLQRAYAQERAAEAGVARLEELIAEENPPEEVSDRLRRLASLHTWIAWERLGDLSEAEPPTATYRRLRREMIQAERAVFVELRDSGELDEEVLRRVQLELDLEETLLSETEGSARAAQAPAGLLAGLFRRAKQLCEHLEAAPDLEPVDRPVCQDCVDAGLRWVHLRQCTACGRIGCCDSSIGRHADAHWRSSHHPVMRSAEPHESWRWCYIDRQVG